MDQQCVSLVKYIALENHRRKKLHGTSSSAKRVLLCKGGSTRESAVYLNAHKFANAIAEDFWSAQTRSSGKAVDQIMTSFIAQPGVPLLRFSAPLQVRLRSPNRAFILTPGAGSETAQSWTVPVCVKTAAIPDCTVIALGTTTVATAPAPVFFGNANAHGYYRSEYEPSTYQALFPRVESALTAEERMVLLGDEGALMRAGRGSPADVLHLVRALRNDPSAGVLASIGSPADGSSGGKLGYLQERVATDPQRTQLAALTRQQFGPVFAQLPPMTAEESYELSQRRAILFNSWGWSVGIRRLSRSQ